MLIAEQKEARKVRKERRARGEYKEPPELRGRKSKANLGVHPGEATRVKMSKARAGKPSPFKGKRHTDYAKEKNSKANSGRILTDVTKAKISEALSGEKGYWWGKTPSAATKAKLSEATSGEKNHNYGKTFTPATKAKMSEANKKSWLDQQWYRTVTYGKPGYCVIFDDKFKERCRAYWEYKSVLKPYKTQAENICGGKPYRLTVHHVYYQPKACCGYDEDLEGYYAMINLGTERKPNIVRHNIKGDPNKFVILTHSENIKANSNKLEWIKKFEDMIEAREGKCYLTKEEMVEYKIKAGIQPPGAIKR